MQRQLAICAHKGLWPLIIRVCAHKGTEEKVSRKSVTMAASEEWDGGEKHGELCTIQAFHKKHVLFLIIYPNKILTN